MYSTSLSSRYGSTGTAEINVISSNRSETLDFDSDTSLFPQTEPDFTYNQHNDNEYDTPYDDVPEKGCLLAGIVSGFRNISIDAKGENNQCFFRILYAEGSSSKSSSLLSARTPIFTSSSLFFDNIMQWRDNNSFRLEVPSHPNLIQGEVIISLYKSRSQGGNDFIGQCVFNLSSIYTSGSMECQDNVLESRMVRGTYPLVTRPTSEAEVTLQIQLLWNKLMNKIMPTPSVIPIAPSKMISKDKDGMSVGSQPSSAAAGRMIRSQSQSSSSRPQSVGKSTSAAHAVRKIASAGMKKRREDELRIERENKVMQSKLQKLATSSSKSININAPSSHQGAYAPTPSPIAIMKNDGVSISNSKQQSSDKELHYQVNMLKQAIIDKSKANANLRGQINKLKSHATKFQLANDRIKKTASRGIDSKADDSVMISGDEDHYKKAADKIQDLYQLNLESNSKRAVDRQDKLWIYKEYAIDKASIKDKELLDTIDEHYELQNIRRNLVHRVGLASKSLSKNHQTSNDIKDQHQLMLQRIKMLYPTYASMLPVSDGDNRIESKADDGGYAVRDAYHRLKQAQLEYNKVAAIHDEGLHISKIGSDLEQKSAIYENLKAISISLKQEVSNTLYERDLWQERLHFVLENRLSSNISDSLAKLKAVLLRLNREQRIADTIMNA